jgi:hypothetical protein
LARCSPESEGSTSASNGPGSEPCGKSNSTPTGEPSSPDTSPKSCDLRTCEGSEPTTSPPSTSSAGASPARTLASPAEERVSTDSVRVFGASTRESFASFDPDTYLWRTSQLSLLGGLTEFSETWPRAGMTRNGTAYLLQPLAPLTGGIASGSLPTPRVADAERGGRGDDLATAVARENWPTPNARDHKDTGEGRYGRGQLPEAVRERTKDGLWTTPTAGDTGHRKRGYAQGGTPLSAQTGGALNPTWVEWLMGFPPGWTVLPPSEIPSSRRSRSGSDGES